MKRTSGAAAVAVAAAVVALLTPHPAAARTAAVSVAPAAARQYYPDVDHITCEINKERTRLNLPPLLVSDRADDVGRSHARDMASMERLTSVGSDGRNLRTRLSNAGVFSERIYEFMFSGYDNDDYFMHMATDPSPDNSFYKAMTSRDFVAWGLGYDRTYWDVNLLGPHRRLGARTAVCAAGSSS
ncbi:CAP domain-containing protein [Streptomyces sp. NPDC101237]|uniref:CAP domain-containing protein n=1 Tax=Streptomyces sp. NPDC101237 TaxID=3366139 RepID=UPI0038258420